MRPMGELRSSLRTWYYALADECGVRAHRLPLAEPAQAWLLPEMARARPRERERERERVRRIRAQKDIAQSDVNSAEEKEEEEEEKKK